MGNNGEQIFKNNWQRYKDLGFIPYPASRKGKNPLPKWKDDLPPPMSDDYNEWEEKYPNANIWLFLGNEFAVLDPDGPGAEDFVKSLNLPSCPTSISGHKSIHRWFKAPPGIKPIKAMNGDDETFLELRTGSMGILAPPSIHPTTKKPYQWLKGQSPWEISFPELPFEAYERIKALLPKSEPQMESPQENSSLGTLDVEKYLNHYGIEYTVKPDSKRTFYRLEKCLFADAHTTKDVPGDSSIIQGADGKLGYFCFHNHCVLRTWQDARQAISGNAPIIEFFRGYKSNPKNREQRGMALLESAIFGAEDFLSLSIPKKKTILNPWLTEQSITLIVGWRGTGKTWFGLSMFDAMTRGEPFGPWVTETPIACLYIDGEMPASDMQERLSFIEGHGARKAPLYIWNDAHANFLGLPRINLNNPKSRQALKDLLIKKSIKLVALDNLASLLSGGDEMKKFDWDPVNQWLLDLRFNGISTIMFHHTGKSETEQRGTSAREDNIDNSILLKRPHDYCTEDGARFIVIFKKNRVASDQLSLISDREFALKDIDGRGRWTQGAVRRKNQIEILRMLDEGISQADIARMLAVSPAFVSKEKAKALRDKHINRAGKLTQSGNDLLYGMASDEDDNVEEF